MTNITETKLELSKGEFYTIEAFYITDIDGDEYEEGDRCEDIDEYYVESFNGDLDTFVKKLAEESLVEEPVIIYAFPRRWAEGRYIEVENCSGYFEMDDYGDVCMGQDAYFYNGKTFTNNVSHL